MSTRRTKTGRVLSDAEFDALANEVASTDYGVEALKARRRDETPWPLRGFPDGA